MARPRTPPSERTLSPAEWQIMRICWRLGRANVRQILHEDLKKRTRDYRTILTFVSRMEKKGFLKVEKEANTNLYTPAVPQEKALEAEIKRFLEQVVGSDRAHLDLVRKQLDKKLRSAKGTRSRRKTAS